MEMDEGFQTYRRHAYDKSCALGATRSERKPKRASRAGKLNQATRQRARDTKSGRLNQILTHFGMSEPKMEAELGQGCPGELLELVPVSTCEEPNLNSLPLRVCVWVDLARRSGLECVARELKVGSRRLLLSA